MSADFTPTKHLQSKLKHQAAAFAYVIFFPLSQCVYVSMKDVSFNITDAKLWKDIRTARVYAQRQNFQEPYEIRRVTYAVTMLEGDRHE